MSARLCARLAIAAVVCSVFSIPAAEASFPGRNGLLAYSRVGPHVQTTIWLADPRTAHIRQLTRPPRRCASVDLGWTDTDPSFSADGRLVVYAHSDHCDPRASDGIYVIRPNGSGRRRLPINTSLDDEYASPGLSPSARRLAFGDGPFATYISSLAPRPSERELRFPRFDQIAYPAWSVTGRLAVGVGQSAFSGHVATVAPSGKDLHLVTRSTRDSLPDWSPTADRIVFQRWKDNPADDAINPKRSDASSHRLAPGVQIVPCASLILGTPSVRSGLPTVETSPTCVVSLSTPVRSRSCVLAMAHNGDSSRTTSRSSVASAGSHARAASTRSSLSGSAQPFSARAWPACPIPRTG